MTTPFATHEVFNQSPPFQDVNLFTSDAALMEAVKREGAMPAVAGLSAWLNLQFAPHAAQRRVALTAEAVRAGLAVPITPGRFRSFDGGRTMIARSVRLLPS